MAIQWNVTPHTRVEIGNSIAEDYGEHMVSLDISEETDGIDNGRIVHVTKMTDLDLWEYEDASDELSAYIVMQHPVSKLWLMVVDSVKDDKLAFIYQKPLIAEESPRQLTNEENFYNVPEDGPVRGYIMHALDRYWISDNGFDGKPSKGATITSIRNGKPVVTAAPTPTPTPTA